MMLVIILLVLSAGLNLFLVYILVRKYDEESLNIIKAEGSEFDRIEYFDLYGTHSFLN